MKTLHPSFSRLFAAGLVGLTLAAPGTASAGLFDPGIFNTGIFGNVLNGFPGGILVPNTPTPVEPSNPEEAAKAEKVIRDKAATSLGFNFTGPAVSGLEVVPGGYRIRYQNCDIYYSEATGAHEVHGDIRAKYNALSGPWGTLGLPATDELQTAHPSGRYNEFSANASIYWSANTGPMVVRGLIRGLWVARSGENGPLGFPMADEKTLEPGRVFSDFQNGVIYMESGRERTPELATLSPAQMQNAVRKLLAPRPGLPIKSTSIKEVSDTVYGFHQSSNRLVTLQIKGRIVNNNWFDGSYDLELRIHFYAQREANGSTTLRAALHSWKTNTFNSSIWTVLAEVHPYAVNPDVAKIQRWLRDSFTVAPKLINLEVPAATPVLSFKVYSNGGLGVHVDPSGFGPLARLAIQRELDTAAKL